MSKSWREHARPIIKQVLKDNAGQPEKVIRKALKNAYPFGMRQYHPYKIWLDEIKVQRGKRKFNERARDVVPANQVKVF